MNKLIYPITKMMNGLSINRQLEFLEIYEQELISRYGLSIGILESIILGKIPDITNKIYINL